MALAAPARYVASTLVGPGRVQVERLPRPRPAAGEVLIRLEGCGVCGSNVPPWEGRSWFSYPFSPGAPGHEGWGSVDELGEGVEGPGVGTRVAALSFAAFAELDVAPAAHVVELSPELAGVPFPGEGVGCAVNVFRRSRIRSGSRVAIVGCGFLGLLLVQLAAAEGADVTAFSRRHFARELAHTAGAGATLGLDDDPEETFDVVIEAAGVQETLDLAARLTRERGTLVVAGFHQDGPRVVDLQLWNWRGLDVVNAHERDPEVYLEGIRAAVDLAASGVLDVEGLVTHRFPLGRLSDALETARARPDGFLKAVVIP